jgi:serine/threonine protein phosphatase PrpC
MIFRLELGKHTAPGINRPQNEDNIGYYFPQQPEVLLLRGQMVMVADGKGEEGLGKFASKLAIQTVIQEYYEEPWVGMVEEMLTKSLIRANRAVYEANIENQSTTPCSTSLTCGVIHQEKLYIAHIGTCRAFLLSSANFEILTRSHSFNVEKGDREIDIQGEENGKVLVRSLGVDEDVKIDIIQRNLQINDIIFLCTDGIYNILDEQEIQSIIASASPQQACELMVKQALASHTPDDATAIAIKVKSIKRVETDEKPSPTVVDQSRPAEREIVIKGIRYRSTWKDEELPPEEKERVDEFSQDRDVRRPILRRTTTRDRKRHFSARKILNILTISVFIAFITFLIVKYVPSYLQSVRSSSQEKVATDTLSQVSDSVLQKDEQKEEIEPAPVIYPEVDEIEDTTKYIVEEEPKIFEPVTLNVVIVDGSFRQNLTWDSFIDNMRKSSDGDRINKIKSSFRLQKSKILWRRGDNPEKEKVIKERTDQYQRLFAQYFEIKPEIYPLDLTIIIGANFNLPRLPTSYRDTKTGDDFDYYLEILNGFTVPGLARRLNELLNYRKINEERLAVVDFRNADRKNYRISFIKCDPSRNDLAEQLGTLLGQRLSVVNSQLFDIKLIVGTDIRF